MFRRSSHLRPITLARFSQRLPLVAAAVLCGFCAWLGYERSVVMERRALRAKLNAAGVILVAPSERNVEPGERPASVRRSRRLFGDEPVQIVLFGSLEGGGESEALKVARVFPEAKFFVPDRIEPWSPAEAVR